MKILMILIMMAFLAACSNDQSKTVPSDDVPESIINSFKSQNPEYSDVEWEREDGYYIAEFEVNGKEKEVVYDKDGNQIFTEIESEEGEDDDEEGENEHGDDNDENEREIDPNELPQVIKSDIQNRYPDAKMLEADEITHPDGAITYDVEIKHNNQIIELMYDARGEFLGIEED
ncbi:MAG: PepSY-like domain-containing protein [Bacteroidales bacterium]|nr:PepSY-like domain-containing protein [Bacteroidales bacterium]